MQVGDSIPAYIQLFDYNTGKFVRAVVRDATNTPITGSPENLANVANGLYGGGALVAPNSKFLTVQYLVYDDSGYTQLSTSEGASLDVLFVGATLRVGDNIPVYFQLFNYVTNKFIRATVRAADGTTVGVVNLTAIANGLYGDASLTMPATPYVTIQFIVYNDSGYTQISSDQGGGSQTLLPSGSASGGTPTFYPILGFLDTAKDCGCDGSIQDRITLGSTHMLAIRLLVDDRYLPIDLTGFVQVEVRLYNADGSVLSLTTSSPGTPVAIVTALLGKITCLLTAAQTALLLAQTPAPLSVVLTDGSGNETIVNFPYQLAITAPAV